ncbi:MAG: hypothetical protein FJ272_15465, partial [Planctomycetes bacterium]|nr:hypothetical protein [Planctomycetota bacterium]
MPTTSILTALSVLLALSAAHAASVPTLEQLQAAPEAKLETFGPIQSAGRVCGWGLSKATKDHPARLLLSFWSMADRSFFATFVADLSTGAVRKVTEPGFDKDAPRWPSVVAADGKYFLSCMGGALAIYDPAKDSFQMVRPIAKASWLRGIALGADGAIYVSDYPTGSAARYDPATGAMEDYGPQGGPFNITNIYGYSVGSDGEWVYTAAGKIPWYVVAYNRTTRQQKNLFKFDQADFPNVFMRGAEVYLSAAIRQPARTEFYRLAGGEATRIEKFPESKPLPGPWDGVPQPEVEIADRGLDMEEGGAVAWYRTADDRERVTKAGLKEGGRAELGWRKLVFPIPGEPYRVR